MNHTKLGERRTENGEDRLKSKAALFYTLLALVAFQIAPVSAQTLTSPDPNANPNATGFKLVSCDGPTLPPGMTVPQGYVPCDFNGVMIQVQHLINVAMVLGVFAAIAGFSYAGFLYVTGSEGNLKKAHEIFPKIFWGFIIMLSAWFIVYQLLGWLTNNSGFKALLGSP